MLQPLSEAASQTHCWSGLMGERDKPCPRIWSPAPFDTARSGCYRQIPHGLGSVVVPSPHTPSPSWGGVHLPAACLIARLGTLGRHSSNIHRQLLAMFRVEEMDGLVTSFLEALYLASIPRALCVLLLQRVLLPAGSRGCKTSGHVYKQQY